MATSKDTLRRWLQDGVKDGKTHMIVICDTFDYEDYPVYAPEEFCKYVDAEGKTIKGYDPTATRVVTKTVADPRLHSQNNSGNMRLVMECYDLRMDMEKQLAEFRAHHWDM